MPKFPIDASKERVIKTLTALGFQMVREREHLSMVRENAGGTTTPLTMPNHSHIKSLMLRTICTQARFSRDEFLRAYEQS